MHHLCSSGIVSDCRSQDAPFAEERNRYLSHCATHGASPAVLKVKRNELLWIAGRLGPDAERGIGMTELLPIAQERQSLHGAASAVRRVVDIGRPWLRFLGWWREPTFPFSHGDQLDRYVAWMREERGLTLSTVEQWSRTTRRFLWWCGDDEEPDRLEATRRMPWAYLRSALNKGDTAWRDACKALEGPASSLGRVDCK